MSNPESLSNSIRPAEPFRIIRFLGTLRALGVLPVFPVFPALFLLISAGSGVAQIQPPVSPWTRLAHAPRMTPDESWGMPEYGGRGGPRMTSDAEGTLFISHGGNLYLGEHEGRSWKTAPVRIHFYVPFSVGLAVGGKGRILWGGWNSLDGGQTWSEVAMFPLSYAIGPNGTALAGTGPEAIFRSMNGEASGSAWKEAKYGKSYQSITHLNFAFPGWAFAAMPQGDLWISRNDGASWFPLQDVMQYFFHDPEYFSLPTMEKGPAGKTLWTIVSDGNSRPLWCEGFQRHGDSALLPLSPENMGFPDSAITALQAYALPSGQSILMLGTWGQGVYVSRDQAASWQAFNTGLKDLHVEALNFSVSGNAQMLTREGLFSTSAFASLAIQRKNPAGRRQESIRTRGASPLFENAAGRFQVDGRTGSR
jgi:hypothetical protein